MSEPLPIAMTCPCRNEMLFIVHYDEQSHFWNVRCKNCGTLFQLDPYGTIALLNMGPL